jgi:addiction module RelB/DinJ family antitoxin
VTESSLAHLLDKNIPLYTIWYMNTKTILNIKIDKKIKEEAQKVSKELGLPLGTTITAFLKQFIREKEIVLSSNEYTPSSYLQGVIREAEKEYFRGDASGPFNQKDFISHLKSL